MKNQDFGGLKITEIHYNPQSSDGIDGENFEFLEFKNTGSDTLSLTGLSLVDGVNFTFASTIVAPGEFIVLASNSTEFEHHYGFVPDGQFIGHLRNSGERIALHDFKDQSLIEVDYDDKEPWPIVPDGSGPSLVAAESNPTGNPNQVDYWKTSSFIGGSPGADDPNSTTNINSNSSNHFVLYPNPANEQLIIEFLEIKSETPFIIGNMLGKMLMTGKIYTPKMTLDITEIKSGVYFLSVMLGDKRLTKFFVKR